MFPFDLIRTFFFSRFFFMLLFSPLFLRLRRVLGLWYFFFSLGLTSCRIGMRRQEAPKAIKAQELVQKEGVCLRRRPKGGAGGG